MKIRLVSLVLLLAVVVNLCTFSANAIDRVPSTPFVSRLNFDVEDGESVRAIIVYDGSSGLRLKNSGKAPSVAAGANSVYKAQKPLNAQVKALGGTVVYSYNTILNGVAVDVKYGDLKKIEKLQGVKAVYLANKYYAPKLQPGAAPSSITAGESMGFDPLRQEGLRGKGTVIAVLDTGTMVNHQAFSYTAGVENTLTAQRVQALKDSARGLNGGGVYHSTKLPYIYDYADYDIDVNSTDIHGTAVAGIAAGNNGSDYYGIASDAQILGMKIFKDGSGYTDASIYFAAIEDAITLGADVINMSLGSTYGFTFDPDLEYSVQNVEIMGALKDAGIFLCSAAGNEYSQGHPMYTKNNYALEHNVEAVSVDYADYGTVNSPSTYEGIVSVASIDNGTKTPSDFSSWGATPDLKLKPELSGVGGNVLCPYAAATDDYVYMSGTSMACPSVAGAIAVVIGGFKGRGYDTDSAPKAFYDDVYDTLLSTAETLYYSGGVPYSPRKQGTGLINGANIVAATAVVDDPVCNLGDDIGKTGVYTVKNALRLPFGYGDAVDVSFAGAEVVCDKYVQDSTTGEYVNILKPYLLSPTVTADKASYGLSGTDSTTDITLTITLTEADKAYLAPYSNGAYIEGYLYFNVNNSGTITKIKTTFMGFYGDWCQAPAMEDADWTDAAEAEYYLSTNYTANGTTLADAGYTVYDVLEVKTGYTEGYLTRQGSIVGAIGNNLYNKLSYDNSRMAIPTGAGTGLRMADGFVIYPSLIRNVSNIIMTVSNSESGEVYFVDDTPFGTKDVYDYEGDMVKSTYFTWDGTDGNGDYVRDGTGVKIAFQTRLDYPGAPLRTEKEYYMYIDNTAPKVVYNWNPATKQLVLAYKDEGEVSNIFVCSEDYEQYFYNRPTVGTIPGKYTVYKVDLSRTDFGALTQFNLEVQDYATNYFSVTLPLNGGVVSNEDCMLKGDVNGDGVINSLDAVQILKYDVFLTSFDPLQAQLADVNGDGIVSSLDAALVLRYDVGLFPEGFGTLKIKI